MGQKVKRLFYWKDSLPSHKDEGKPLKVGVKITIKGYPQFTVTRVEDIPYYNEQRIWLA